MLLPTILIIAVNLALGFLAAVGRERLVVLRAAENVETAELPSEGVADAADSEQPTPPAAAPPAQEPEESQAANVGAVESSKIVETPSAEGAESMEEPPVDEPAEVAAIDEQPAEPVSAETPPVDEIADAASPDAVDEIVDDVDDAPQAVDVASAAADSSAELPSEWFELLADIEKEGYGKCQSFVEASTQVLRLEVGRYRSELVAIDNRIRTIFADFQPEALSSALAELDRINADWLSRQGEAVGHLASRRDQLGELQATGERLEDVLLEQTAQIESTQTNLRQVDVAAEPDKLQRRVLVETGRLLDMAHALRDQLQEALLAIVLGENRVATLDRRLHVDTLTGFVNRTGLEVVLYEWWRDDPRRIRPLTVVMFDVCRTARFNERHGASVGDAMLAAVGKIIDDTLRKKRGCDLVARHSGQRFIVVLGDTGPQNATSAAERIRQGIAASTFEVASESAQVSASCGVVEVTAEDDSRSVLRRLELATSQAKKLGRNITCLDRGAGPAAIENPPDYKVKGKIVRLNS